MYPQNTELCVSRMKKLLGLELDKALKINQQNDKSCLKFPTTINIQKLLSQVIDLSGQVKYSQSNL